MRRSDRLFYFTTCGWMMWNWLVSALATGATLVLYDGSPVSPGPGSPLAHGREERLTHFRHERKIPRVAGEKRASRRRRAVDLSALRTILSTGSPLLPDGFDFVYRDVKADVQLASISGGTDIVSCFALGCPTRPVYRGEIQCRGLGMARRSLRRRGRPVRGERGELVCTAPFPSMPVGFWNDPDGAKYRAAYFERFPGVWHHGDYAALTEHDGLIIYGRSDAVLNPGGVRIGTAEIYSAVEGLVEIAEALAVGQDWQGDVRVVLFVRLQAGYTLDEPLDRRRFATRSARTRRPATCRRRSLRSPTCRGRSRASSPSLRYAMSFTGCRCKNVDALANPAGAGALSRSCRACELT